MAESIQAVARREAIDRLKKLLGAAGAGSDPNLLEGEIEHFVDDLIAAAKPSERTEHAENVERMRRKTNGHTRPTENSDETTG